ncbi:MAG: ribose 5-phosphate isomerase B [Chitinophagaceae bacterium]|nr:ribose 5-phosphate isomerase B [Chitinophagaceae bacterium]MDP1811839.1 ribose 5-phosphate isomerase B [Sediminibacterium sp.]MDP3127630.1 ribose 5-phosphate isomerase B [Sediminibacterium sp.]MDP3667683.1 ribose 5-phosphate isomerase B [Sediminibacterium sp.]
MSYVFDPSKPIAIGCDHAGIDYKNALVKWLSDKGYQVKDFGAYSTESVDYPDFAHPTASSVENGETAFGILLCGSANGVAITANKHQNIRAGLCWQNDVALLVRKHNDANIICIPARFVSLALAEQMLDLFMTTAFEGGRHATRVNKISCS